MTALPRVPTPGVRHVAGATLLAVALALVVATPAALADHRPDHETARKLAATVAGATLTLATSPRTSGPVSIEASLTDPAGEPMTGVTVDFFVAVEFFGSRTIALGSARTDAAGTARIPYWPSWSGTHRLAARTAGTDGSRLTSPERIETLAAVGHAIREREVALPITAFWAPPVAILAVAAVWGTLAALFIAVVVGVRRAARPTAGTGQRALGRPDPAPGPGTS